MTRANVAALLLWFSSNACEVRGKIEWQGTALTGAVFLSPELEREFLQCPSAYRMTISVDEASADLCTAASRAFTAQPERLFAARFPRRFDVEAPEFSAPRVRVFGWMGPRTLQDNSFGTRYGDFVGVSDEYELGESCGPGGDCGFGGRIEGVELSIAETLTSTCPHQDSEPSFGKVVCDGGGS